MASTTVMLLGESLQGGDAHAAAQYVAATMV